MFRKCFDFSGVRLCISAPCELAVTDKLSRFETEREDACVTVRLSFADALPQPHEGDGRRYLYNTARDKNAAPYAAVEGEGADRSILVSEEYRKFTDAVSVLKALDLNHILLERNAVVLHASYIEHEGDAVLFCAPSGTGKSTQAELWKKYRSTRIINGDRCLIRKGEAGFTAGGIYYSGTSEYCENRTLPIKAIVLLRKARENSIEPIGGITAFRSIFRECAHKTAYPDDPALAAILISELVKTVPTALLSCLPDEGAVCTLEEYLRRI